MRTHFESICRITLSVFAVHEGTAHDRRGQALVDDLGELADDFDFHHDPSFAPRKAQYAVTIGSPKDVARSKRQYVGGQRERERILSYCEFATDTLLAAVRANGKLKAGVERP